jgi:nucleoside transporter
MRTVNGIPFASLSEFAFFPSDLINSISMTTEPPLLTATPRAIRYRLCVMMFLQYFIQGSYLPVISAYLQDGLGFESAKIGAFGSALALGPLLAPFIVGQIVDRMFATQWVLAACHILGGLIMIVLYQMTGFLPILLLGAVYSALYVPTMFLTNSLAFHHLADREREFPLVRLWGTIGFIVPAWCIEPFYLSHFEGDALDKARGIVLIFSGVSGLVMAVYCLTLPHTPPAKNEQQEYAPGKVLGLLRLRNFAVLVGISLVVAIVHKYFWVWNPVYLRDLLDEVGIKQAVEQRISSIGQIAEIVVMAGLGFMLKKLGFKKVMLIGTLAYVLRFIILAWVITIPGGEAELTAGGWLKANPTGWMIFSLLFAGQALHGFCFACYLAAAYIYVDKVSPPDVRGSMQTFFGIFVVGAGLFLGGLVAGAVGAAFEPSPGVHNWPGIWLSGAAIAAVAMIAFAALFPKEVHQEGAQHTDTI